MRSSFPFLILFLLFISCYSNDDIEESDLMEMSLDPVISEDQQEYIILEVEGNKLYFFEARKSYDENNLGAELIPQYNLNGNLYHILNFWGFNNNMQSNEVQRLGGFIKQFDGNGKYYVGRESDNNCHFFNYGISWQSYYDTKGEGYVEIINYLNQYIEGTFNFAIHNTNDISKSKIILGKFRLKIDE
jgi:hypothetical protein